MAGLGVAGVGVVWYRYGARGTGGTCRGCVGVLFLNLVGGLFISKYFFIIFGVGGTALHRADRLRYAHDATQTTNAINGATTNFHGKSSHVTPDKVLSWGYLLYNCGKIRDT